MSTKVDSWSRVWKNASRRDLFVVAFVALVLAALPPAFLLSRSSATVHVVNGLDIPVTVRVGDKTAMVGPRSRGSVSLRRGVYIATATKADGEVIDSTVIHSDTRADAVVYNVLGASPLILGTIRYTPSSSKAPDESKPEFMGGQRVIVARKVDYLFTEPPKSITTSSKGGEIVKRALLIPEDTDWRSTVGYLLSHGKAVEANDLMRSISHLDPDDIKVYSYLSESTRTAYGMGSMTPFLLPVLRDRPSDDLASVVRFEGCKFGLCDESIAALQRISPSDSVARKLLLLRSAPEKVARAEIAALAAAHPADLEVMAARAWLAHIDQQWSECERLYAAAAGRPRGGYDIDTRSSCLYAAGRTSEALAVTAKVAQAGGETEMVGALAYARIATLARESPLRFLEQKDEKGGDAAERRTMVAVYLGTIDDKVIRPKGVVDAATLAIDASLGPSTAYRSWAKAKADVFGRLPDPLLVVMGTEIARLGDLPLARRVLASADRFPLSADDAFDYVFSGKEATSLYRLDPELRAGLDFVRGRRLEQLGEDAHAVYAAARRRDVLKGWTTRLMHDWQPPERQTTQTPVRVVAYRAQ